MAIQLTTEYIPTDSLRPHPDNPRRGNVAAICESLERNGQYRPLVVNRQTMEVLCGNHTLRAARELGWEKIAVTFVDVDSEQAKRILLVDTRTNDRATYDLEALLEVLQGLDDLGGTGYDDRYVRELVDELSPAPLAEDEPPPLPAEPETRAGDLYLLGDHRLLCADAREPESYARLLGNEQADLLWTDPPYGIAYQGKTKDGLRIANDGAAGLEALLAESFAAADAALAPDARLYVAHPAGKLALTFGAAFVGQGWRLRQTLVWVKDAFVLGRSDWHYRHEPIYYGHKPADRRIGRGAKGWYGDNAQDSVLEVARPRASRDHPTMKPPELVERCCTTRRAAATSSSIPSRARDRRLWPVRPREGRRDSSSSTPAMSTSSSPASRA
jgi:ParB/Sulfiredoxin domain